MQKIGKPMFTLEQKQMLKRLARHEDHPQFGQPNEALDNYIQELQEINPMAFVHRHELHLRNFYHRPKNRTPGYEHELPYKSYLQEFV
jgi:hypothetical protein